jgi:putative transposase
VPPENSVLTDSLEVAPLWPYVPSAMFAIMLSLFFSIRKGFRSRAALQAEVLALRHQLLVLQRSGRRHKLHLHTADRLLWVLLSRLWGGWRSALVIVKPETVIAWHRRGFRLYWSWKSRHRQGRPSVSREVIDLIRKMSLANPRWGAPKIPGEVSKLGFVLRDSCSTDRSLVSIFRIL